MGIEKIEVKNKKVIAISAVIIFIIGISYVLINTRDKAKEVTIEKVIQKTIEETTTAVGNIEPNYRNNIQLNFSQKVLEIKVEEGQVVKKGDVLLILDSYDYESKLKEEQINLENAKVSLNQMVQTGIASEKSTAENSLLQAKSNVEIAKRKYEDLKKKYDQSEALFNSESISKNEFDDSKKNKDDAETYLKIAEDSLKNAEIMFNDTNNKSDDKVINQKNQIKLIENNIANYEKKINDSKIVSNIDGKVIKIDPKENQFPSSGDEIIIDDISIYKVIVELNQYDALKASKGQKSNIKIKGSTDLYGGTVSEIGEFAEEKITASGGDQEYKVKVTVLIDEPKVEIKSGFEADVQFIFKEREDCLVVGFDGIKEDKETKQKYVYVIDSNNKVSKRYIKVGIESEYYVEVIQGLNLDEKYVLNPPQSLVEGDFVS